MGKTDSSFLRTGYSILVDEDPDSVFQSLLLIASLINNAGVAPGDIYVHVLDDVDGNLMRSFQKMGVQAHRIAPFRPSFPHSNRLNQLRVDGWRMYDKVVICDCDIAVVRAFSEDMGDQVSSCAIADDASLPGGMLERLFCAAGLPFCVETAGKLFRSGSVGGKHERTGGGAVEQNCRANAAGGLYIVDTTIIPALADAWAKWALWLLERRARRGTEDSYVARSSLALALAEIGVTPSMLPARCYPSLHPFVDPAGVDSLDQIAVVRYGSAVDDDGLPRPGNIPSLIDAVERIKNAWRLFAHGLQADENPDFGVLVKRRERWLQWRNVISRRRLPLPDHVDREKPIVAIETVGACNYNCPYCPVSVTPKRNGRMSRELYDRILDDLRSFDSDIQLRLHFYNEPLLDTRLPDLIRLAKVKLPGTFIRVVSNGRLLTMQVAEALFRAGLDQLVVSGHRKEDVERILGAFCGHKWGPRIAVRRDYLRKSWSDRLASVPLEQNDYARVRPIGVKPWGCSFLTVQIDYLGQVHQCCEDYQGDLILGNVNDGTVGAILQQHLNRLKRVFCGRFEGVCAHCAASNPLP